MASLPEPPLTILLIIPSSQPGGRSLAAACLKARPYRMKRDKTKMADKILNLALEIIFHLTGEDYTVVKTSSDRCQAPMSEGRGGTLSPIPGPPPHPRIHEDINAQKILELTNKMIELLTGEVPIRCQDVTVYFSMEEWEYLEGHKDRYQEVMEEHRPRTSPEFTNQVNSSCVIDWTFPDAVMPIFWVEQLVPQTGPDFTSDSLKANTRRSGRLLV
ncbi:oocyte zinc finger protein XlCOF7.1-like [Dendrobates tinctorius]|uniref:oocyte zinc finger protein XlCOF7.1-like n=1 Tax=Dendrobates tinctorius TaxID=92724 RepID=UPI003CCA3768